MPTYDYSATLICDFSTKLYNKQLNHSQVKDYMKKLHRFNGFTLIVPRKYLKFIECNYYNTRTLKIEDGIQYEDDCMINSFTEK
jgi:hypothetical protein